MKLPKKIQQIIEDHEIDINNFTNEDINYRLNTIFKLSDLDWYRSRDRNILLRSAGNNKDHELHMGGDVPIEVDIFYIKLFKEGLIDINMYQLEYDTNTKEGIELEKFLLKYTSNNFEGDKQSISFSGGGNTIIDLKSIVKNEYEKFMELILLNLLPGKIQLNEDNWDIITYDKFVMDVEITDIDKFIKGYCNLLGRENNRTEIIKELMDHFNNYDSDGFGDNQVLLYKLSEFSKKTGIYSLLCYLEKLGKLKIRVFDVIKAGDNIDYINILYSPYVVEIKEHYFDGFELYKEDIIKTFEIEYTDKGLDLNKGEYKTSFDKGSKPYKIVEVMFKKKNTINKSMGLATLFKLLYGEDFQRSLHKNELEDIRSAVSSINRKVKPINNGNSILSFKEQVLRKI